MTADSSFSHQSPSADAADAVAAASRWIRPLRTELGRYLIGQTSLVDRLLIALLVPALALGVLVRRRHVDDPRPQARLAAARGRQAAAHGGVGQQARARLGRRGEGRARLAPHGLVLGVGAALGLLLVPLALPASDAWTRPSGPTLSVRLLQGNVPQDMKFRPDRTLAAMQAYVGLIEAGDAALTILPETAWTIPFERTPPELAQRLDAHVGTGRAVAIGLPAFTLDNRRGLRDDWRLTNSVLLLEPGGAADRYGAGDRGLAIACASHAGTTAHAREAFRLLWGAQLEVQHLQKEAFQHKRQQEESQAEVQQSMNDLAVYP
jgi:hypothetical protein